MRGPQAESIWCAALGLEALMTLRTALKLSMLLAICLTTALAAAAGGSGKFARIVILLAVLLDQW